MTGPDPSEHWNRVYTTRAETEVSWFDPEADESFAAVASLAKPGDPIIDVGAGASRLVDRLIDAGLGPVTVLDVSEAALAVTRSRLGNKASAVTFIAADITRWTPGQTWAVWHDRAVFHFLTDEDDRRAYARALSAGVMPGGHAVLSTFADDGPERCSGLPVLRYAPEVLTRELDGLAPGAFRPVTSARLVHRTPSGAEQRFQTSVFRRNPD